MKLYQMADPVRFPCMTTEELRSTFLVEQLFRPGELELVYVDLDRAVIGSAVPSGEPLLLPCPAELRSSYFNERRELGVLNSGGPGFVTVDGVRFDLDPFDCLYVGRGVREVVFESAAAEQPAAFYLLSYPAHTTYPTARVTKREIKPVELGSPETSNRRSIYKAISADGIKSCQLVLGYTVLDPGSNWNTMPPHTHMRRSEIYFYFNLDPAHRVFHLMGPPQETRHLVVGNREVAIAPGWSIHAGVGTSSYAFCWGMGGENQAYDDMDPVAIAALR